MIPWNIFLAIIPCVFAYLFLSFRGRRWFSLSLTRKMLFFLCFVAWFLFYPNTAYLFTDIRHLLDYCPRGSFEDVCLPHAWMIPVFFVYAMTGLVPFVWSLRSVSFVLSSSFNGLFGRVFPIIMIPLTALGVLIGLIERWNSWDIIRFPLGVLEISWTYMVDGHKLMTLGVYTLVLYVIYYGAGWVWGRR